MTSEPAENISPEEPIVERPRPKIRVRDARIHDIPQIVDMLEEFIRKQKRMGNKLYTEGDFLRGGITVELGLAFHNKMWKVIVADRNNILVGVLIGVLEHCSPLEKYTNCVRIKADYVTENSLARPGVLRAMWDKLIAWGEKFEVGYYYGLIHPGNQPSIKTAKSVGFKHHATQFVKLAKEEVENNG